MTKEKQHKGMDKFAIAQILREIGIYVELLDENPSKGFSYRRAAETIENVPNLDDYVSKSRLEELPGIGKKIAHLITQGVNPYYENLRKQLPDSIFELLNIPGISVQKVRVLYRDFGVESLKDLRRLLRKKEPIGGFSSSFLRKLRKRTESIQKEGYSLLWNQAMSLAQGLCQSFKSLGDVEISGELRRKNALIYSIDIVCSFFPPLAHPHILKIVSKTKQKVKVLLKKGITATFHIAAPNTFPFILLRSTGSKTHFTALNKQGALDSLKHLDSEKAIYKCLKLPFIPPEIREDGLEIRYAKKYPLPDLIEPEDLHGAFHCHTSASDGVNDIASLVAAAKKLGWSYIGISDHSQSLKIAHGMDEKRLLEQIEEIRSLNRSAKTHSFYIFSGIECDILKDGKLDFEDAILKKLDFVIASVHSHFHLNKKEMTQRFIKAIENPYTTMIGHLSGRLLRYRDPYEIDVMKILDACAANDTIIELNAYPNRMDMDWRYWRIAKEKGVLCCINPDAHSAEQLHFCDYGINSARKGWLEKEDVINTLPLKKMLHFIKNRRMR